MKKYIFWALLMLLAISSLGCFAISIISKDTLFAILGALLALAALLTYLEIKSIHSDPFFK
ncbi:MULTISPECIES: hypothetical protein [unclassified Acinetobacter]|jgi:uncharacterized membrane protein YfcA|uniref:hypothetical protein n=1 Tax=unclassified Acinetobacter TaxID=196816 RepID=UPI0015D10C85|nr:MULTISPECIES: hypothetical protein [unclassified Acinetobacter]